MKKTTIRVIDERVYTKEKRYSAPKESFKQVVKILGLADPANQTSKKKLIDIGGATGEFLYYVRTLNPHIELHCVDYSQKLVSFAKSFLNKHNISIQKGDANNLSMIPTGKYDFVVSIGVTNYFDDFRPSFNEMIRVAKPGAKCLNQTIVNEYPIDVVIRYRDANTGESEIGWNKVSMYSIKKHLNSTSKVKNIKFFKHVMPFDIPQKKDIMRCWTKHDKNGKRILWNGLNMEISLYQTYFQIKK